MHTKTTKGRLPNLIIIGAQKCATTSLHYYLGLHPQILMSREKELDFFFREGNWSKGAEWYTSHFRGAAKIYGETSPNYTNFPFFQNVPERMQALIPGAQLIYILRDPLERIISQYMHYCADGRETRPLAEVLMSSRYHLYLCRSKYYLQLEQYFCSFPSSQILIITTHDLLHWRYQTLQKIFRFLGVDDTFFSPRFFYRKHQSWAKRRQHKIGRWLTQLPGVAYLDHLPFGVREQIQQGLSFPFSRRIERPTLDTNVRVVLIRALQDDMRRLRHYTGRAFAEWGV